VGVNDVFEHPLEAPAFQRLAVRDEALIELALKQAFCMTMLLELAIFVAGTVGKYPP
jgi:hypothetical protein